MSSVALIGPDGAGKTTITRMLCVSSSLRLKHVYMGINIEASNHALPTSRLVEYFRRRQHKNRERVPAESEPSQPEGKRRLGATICAFGRLVNRVAEEWFRQVVSWVYQARGNVVLYDRHFLFDFLLDEAGDQPFDQRWHRWFLTHLYPVPDLVIYLDAPAEVLFARKGEKSVEELERRRQAFLRQGARMPRFVQLDATQPLLKVYTDVVNCIHAMLEEPSTPGRPKRRVWRLWRTYHRKGSIG